MARFAAALLLLTLCTGTARAVDLPSFMQKDDTFCTSENDYDDLVRNGHVRPDAAIENCHTVLRPTRVAVMRGQGGVKSLVMVLNGAMYYTIGWTNAKLPVVR